MRDDSYIVIQGWMVNNLHLSGNELLVYALIFGFSQDRESKFYGSHRYVAESCGMGLRTVPRTIDSLLEKNLIIKDEEYVNGVKFCRYRINPDAAVAGGMPEWQRGTAKMADNNINNNKDNNKNIEEEYGLTDSKLDTAIKTWFAYKRERKQAYTKTGANTLINRCRKYATMYGEDAIIKLIDDSITNNYQGIIFDRLDRQKKQTTTTTPSAYARRLN